MLMGKVHETGLSNYNDWHRVINIEFHSLNYELQVVLMHIYTSINIILTK